MHQVFLEWLTKKGKNVSNRFCRAGFQQLMPCQTSHLLPMLLSLSLLTHFALSQWVAPDGPFLNRYVKEKEDQSMSYDFFYSVLGLKIV